MLTNKIISRFSDAFAKHDATVLPQLVDADCVMETADPAPDGARIVGREACLAFWQTIVHDHTTQFEPEEIVAVANDRGALRWRYQYGPGERDYNRGVTLIRVRDGMLVEALIYSKTPGS
ncbi:nuclear transport factor 2 family protein [Streptomyces sp. NPDC047061]|uniref:nuclear transport factor 2 family protein n=1 Tax=Streptomyces sp. NPDC047061 TaxID=3154605 RepID=UPI0033F09CC7